MDYFGLKLATCSSDRSIKVFDVKQEQYNLQQELIGWAEFRIKSEIKLSLKVEPLITSFYCILDTKVQSGSLRGLILNLDQY